MRPHCLLPLGAVGVEVSDVGQVGEDLDEAALLRGDEVVELARTNLRL